MKQKKQTGPREIWSNADEYSFRIQMQYNGYFNNETPHLPDGEYDTAIKVVRKVLGEDNFKKWKTDTINEDNKLRKKFGMDGIFDEDGNIVQE